MDTNLQVETANQIVLQFDGRPVGLVQNLDCTEEYGIEPATGIGDIHVLEYVPTVARYNLSISVIALRKNSLRSQDILPLNGEDVLKGRVFDICIFSKNGGPALLTYKSVTIGSAGVQINKNAIIMNNCSGAALRVIRGKDRGL
jgi:hypothetical protein